jgi:hypothetical protein
MTTASASLGDIIVVINENNDDDSLTTRQGATFDNDATTASLRYAAFDRKPHVKRPSDRRY